MNKLCIVCSVYYIKIFLAAVMLSDFSYGLRAEFKTQLLSTFYNVLYEIRRIKILWLKKHSKFHDFRYTMCTTFYSSPCSFCNIFIWTRVKIFFDILIYIENILNSPDRSVDCSSRANSFLLLWTSKMTIPWVSWSPLRLCLHYSSFKTKYSSRSRKKNLSFSSCVTLKQQFCSTFIY